MVFVQSDSKQKAMASVPDSPHPGQLDEQRRGRAVSVEDLAPRLGLVRDAAGDPVASGPGYTCPQPRDPVTLTGIQIDGSRGGC